MKFTINGKPLDLIKEGIEKDKKKEEIIPKTITQVINENIEKEKKLKKESKKKLKKKGSKKK